VEALSCVRREFVLGSNNFNFPWSEPADRLESAPALVAIWFEHVKRCAAGLAAAQSRGMWRPRHRLPGINVRPNPSENRYGRTDHEPDQQGFSPAWIRRAMIQLLARAARTVISN
jgi:hypothetical protein